IDLNILKKRNIINQNIKRAKIILSGKIYNSVIVKGILVTKGARSAIEKCGGKIEG
ncbi:MAG: uL15 family ribosomal protein, partial [Buchnera aphidicola]|nr:uL15 family ribosomal protein [Buchnera aphidicola]